MAAKAARSTTKTNKPRKRKTADKILMAAEELLGELGYDGTSVRDIAKRAGVNKALVFYHFNSKAELFERVLDRYYEAHLTALETGFRSQGSIRERLHTMIDVYFDFAIENRLYPRLIQRMVTGNDELNHYVERQLKPLVHWVQEALKELSPETGPLSAKHFFVDFSGMVINYFTYAPVLGSIWQEDPLSEQALQERREHLHWILDAFVERLERRNHKDPAASSRVQTDPCKA